MDRKKIFVYLFRLLKDATLAALCFFLIVRVGLYVDSVASTPAAKTGGWQAMLQILPACKMVQKACRCKRVFDIELLYQNPINFALNKRQDVPSLTEQQPGVRQRIDAKKRVATTAKADG